MTSTDVDGLSVGAYLAREDPRDALCGASAIEPGMRIGTASIRRRSQLLALELSLSIEPLRGNIDTRLRKRGERGLDAVVLAACGLDRLGLGSEIGHRFEPARSCRRPDRVRSRFRFAAATSHFVAGGEPRETRAQGRPRARVRGGDRRGLSRSDRGASRR